MGWRVMEPISPYHGLRAMPGRYGGEPFFAAGPTSSIDLIAGQAIESALLVAWCRRRFRGRVALAGISMTSFVAQQVASRCRFWPSDARPDAIMLISHSGRIEDVTFDGELAVTLGLDRALRGGRLVAREAGPAFAPRRSEPDTVAATLAYRLGARRDRPVGALRCRPGRGAAMGAAGAKHLQVSARPPWHARAACARYRAVRTPQAGVGGNVAPVEDTSRTSLLRTARPNWSKFPATMTNEPGPPMTFSS